MAWKSFLFLHMAFVFNGGRRMRFLRLLWYSQGAWCSLQTFDFGVHLRFLAFPRLFSALDGTDFDTLAYFCKKCEAKTPLFGTLIFVSNFLVSFILKLQLDIEETLSKKLEERSSEPTWIWRSCMWCEGHLLNRWFHPKCHICRAQSSHKPSHQVFKLDPVAPSITCSCPLWSEHFSTTQLSSCKSVVLLCSQYCEWEEICV